MTKRITVIDGHPDRSGTHLADALAQTYADAAARAGHQVRRINVGALDFPLLRSAQEYSDGSPPLAIVQAQEAIAWAQHLVIVYPLWEGGMPAMLKGFFEQTFRPGFAFAYRSSGFPQALLKRKSARIFVTMGMPAIAYRWFFGAHSLKSLKRGMLKFCGVFPVRDTLFGRVTSATEATRKGWFECVARLAESAR